MSCTDFGDVQQAARADVIHAILVFLHLLEADTEPIVERRLAHVQHNSAPTHTTADVFVDGIGGSFLHHLNRMRAEGLARKALLPHPYLVPYARSPASPLPGAVNARPAEDSSIAAVQIGSSGVASLIRSTPLAPPRSQTSRISSSPRSFSPS